MSNRLLPERVFNSGGNNFPPSAYIIDLPVCELRIGDVHLTHTSIQVVEHIDVELSFPGKPIIHVRWDCGGSASWDKLMNGDEKIQLLVFNILDFLKSHPEYKMRLMAEEVAAEMAAEMEELNIKP